MKEVYASIQENIDLPKIIHIIGTNGKGSTGRFLAGMLKEAGFKVGHYTSPHILRFNERIWIDGEEIGDEALERYHQRLLALLPKRFVQRLSYFEYTTFLAILAFEKLDFAVVEAGLGGEYDATSVFENILTLITPIDFDHSDFLGDSIESITTTKLRAIQKRAIIAQQEHKEVYNIANTLAKPYKRVEEYGTFVQAQKVVRQNGIPLFFANNLALASAAMKELDVKYDMQKGVRYRLPGRYEKLGNILIDVGHNPLSAKAIANTLDKRVVLVYNSFKDKPYEEILKILKPKIEEVQIIPLQGERIVERSELERVLTKLNMRFSDFEGFEKDREYLVYGSFSVIEEIKRRWLPNFTNI